MRRLAAGLLIASLFLVGCGETKKTPAGAKTEPAKTVKTDRLLHIGGE